MATSVIKKKSPEIRKVNVSPRLSSSTLTLTKPDLRAPKGPILTLDCDAHVSHFLRQSIFVNNQNANSIKDASGNIKEKFVAPKGTILTLNCENHVTHFFKPSKF